MTARDGWVRWRTGRWLAAMVAAGLGGGSALTTAVPAYGLAPVPVTVSVTDPAGFTPGEQHTVAFTVTNLSSGDSESLTATIVIARAGGAPSPDFTFAAGPSCFNAGASGGTCRFGFPEESPGRVLSLSFVVTASSAVTDVPSGARAVFDGSTITVSNHIGGTPVSGGFDATLTGSGATPASTISGVVDDGATGRPVTGAVVTLRDAAGRSYQVTADASGRFTYTVDAATPVSAGPFVLTVTRAGYQPYTGASRTFTPGTSITNLNLLMQPMAVMPSTNSPATGATTPGASAATPPADATGQGGAATDDAIGADTDAQQSGSTDGTVLYLLLSGLALMVVGSIVGLWALRRRRADRGGQSWDPDRDHDLPAAAPWQPPRLARRPAGSHGPPMPTTMDASARVTGWRPEAVTEPLRPPAREAAVPGLRPEYISRPRETPRSTAPPPRSTRVRVYGVDGFGALPEETSHAEADGADR